MPEVGRAWSDKLFNHLRRIGTVAAKPAAPEQDRLGRKAIVDENAGVGELFGPYAQSVGCVFNVVSPILDFAISCGLN